MYRIAVCDDEKIFLDYIKKLLQQVLQELGADSEICSFSDGGALLRQVEADRDCYHLILLDIFMGQVNGYELAKRIRTAGCRAGIVFVTSTDSYLRDGYSLYPVQYLLKPVTKQQLFEAVARDYRERSLDRNILVPVLYGEAVVSLEKLLYVEALNRKIYYHLPEGVTESCDTLQHVLKRLPVSQFVRCHKSYIVNLKKISRLSRTVVFLQDGMQVPAGRAYYDETMRALLACMK